MQFIVLASRPSLVPTLPVAGKLIHNKPNGRGWVNLLSSANDWNFEPGYWQLSNNILRGQVCNEKVHHYSYTKKSYTDFELHVTGTKEYFCKNQRQFYGPGNSNAVKGN